MLDPEKRLDPEHFVAGGQAGVAIRLENLSADVESFLADAADGLALAREGSPEARERLSAAEAAYAGDFLEGDAYEDWASDLREEARVAYVAVARALAGLATAAGASDEACFFLLRVLERDPYDEKAHLDLVLALDRAGRHGDARRAYAAYTARMNEIGIEARPTRCAQGP